MWRPWVASPSLGPITCTQAEQRVRRGLGEARKAESAVTTATVSLHWNVPRAWGLGTLPRKEQPGSLSQEEGNLGGASAGLPWWG